MEINLNTGKGVLMKTLNKTALTLAIASLFAGGQALANGNSATAMNDAAAHIIKPIKISATQALDFGTIISPMTVTETFSVATDGSTSGGSEGMFFGGTQQKAIFGLYGQQGYPVTVTSSAGACSDASDPLNGGVSLAVNDDTGGSVILDAITGGGYVNVGGALSVDAGAMGNFTCKVTVTAAY